MEYRVACLVSKRDSGFQLFPDQVFHSKLVQASLTCGLAIDACKSKAQSG